MNASATAGRHEIIQVEIRGQRVLAEIQQSHFGVSVASARHRHAVYPERFVVEHSVPDKLVATQVLKSSPADQRRHVTQDAIELNLHVTIVYSTLNARTGPDIAPPRP